MRSVSSNHEYIQTYTDTIVHIDVLYVAYCETSVLYTAVVMGGFIDTM